MGLHCSVGRALQRQRKGHGFESRCSPEIFFGFLCNCSTITTATIISSFNWIQSINEEMIVAVNNHGQFALSLGKESLYVFSKFNPLLKYGDPSNTDTFYESLGVRINEVWPAFRSFLYPTVSHVIERSFHNPSDFCALWLVIWQLNCVTFKTITRQN